MHRPTIPIVRVLVCALVVFATPMASGMAGPTAKPVPLECKGGLFGGVKDYVENISGAKCTSSVDGTTRCYLAADEDAALQRISVSTRSTSQPTCQAGRVISHPKGLSCLKNVKKELDFEAMAGNNKAFYVTGSWGNKRKKKAKIAKPRWVVVRQPLTFSGGLEGNCAKRTRGDLKDIFESYFKGLSPFADKPLQCGGLNIEGLALLNDHLFFGLRSPSHVKAGAAFVLSIPANVLFPDAPGNGRAGRHALHFKLNGKTLKGSGIRALERFDQNRLLVVSGPAGVGTEGLSRKGQKRIAKYCNPPRPPFYDNSARKVPYALWLWTPKTGRIEHVATIGGKYKGKKLEGVAVLAKSSKATKLLLTFDGAKPNKLSPLATITIRP